MPSQKEFAMKKNPSFLVLLTISFIFLFASSIQVGAACRNPNLAGSDNPFLVQAAASGFI